MKELNRKITYHESSGMACGPVSICSIDAEITVQDEDGKTVYLHAQWVDAASDDMIFEASTESLYDAYKAINDDEDEGGEHFEELLDVRDEREDTILDDDSKFHGYYDELYKMVKEEMEKQGFELDDEDEDEE